MNGSESKSTWIESGRNQRLELKVVCKKGNFADLLVEDNQVREYVKKKLYAAGVSKVLIERAAENKIRVIVLTARPGMVIGRSGNGVDELKAAWSR